MLASGGGDSPCYCSQRGGKAEEGVEWLWRCWAVAKVQALPGLLHLYPRGWGVKELGPSV